MGWFTSRWRWSGAGVGWGAVMVGSLAVAIVGCASPGPPMAPSLGLPRPVRDLSVSRTGDLVTLRFTVPNSTTDKVALRGGTVAGQFCRSVDGQACTAVPGSRVKVATAGTGGAGRNVVVWTDNLPPELTRGAPRLLGYEVEFFGRSGHAAGWSEMAYTAAGRAPAQVQGFGVEGSRMGVVLRWNAVTGPGEVVIQRRDLAAEAGGEGGRTQKPAAGEAGGGLKRSKATVAGVVWLGTQRPTGEAQTVGVSDVTGAGVLDTTALPDTPYAYRAERRVQFLLGGKTIHLRSEPTSPVDFTLREVYPPRTPAGVRAVGYFAGEPTRTGPPTQYAVDLIWQPVDEAGTIVPLAGYNVYRQRADEAGEGERLNSGLVTVPSFHDGTARAGVEYRYSVRAVDAKGNVSGAGVTVVGGSPRM